MVVPAPVRAPCVLPWDETLTGRRSTSRLSTCPRLPSRVSCRCFPSSRPDTASFRSCLLLPPRFRDTLEAGTDASHSFWLHIHLDISTRRNKKQNKQERAIEKPKLEHARKLRGSYSVDPSDEEYKDIIKNARRKLETAKAAAMPRKRAFSQACIRETIVSKTEKANACEAKTRFICITEAHEATRQSATKRIHEEHTGGKGQNSVLH